MSKKEQLKTLLKEAVIRLNTTRVAYHFIILNQEIESIYDNKRITNKSMIRQLKKINIEIDHLKNEIQFLTN